MKGNMCNIISTKSKYYIIELSYESIDIIPICEYDNVSIGDISEIIYNSEDNIISIIMYDMVKFDLHINCSSYKIPLSYTINRSTKYDFSNYKNNLLPDTIINCSKKISLCKTINGELYLQRKCSHININEMIFSNVKSIGNPIYRSGYHYITFITIDGLYVIKINKDIYEIHKICNLYYDKFCVLYRTNYFYLISGNTIYFIKDEPYIILYSVNINRNLNIENFITRIQELDYWNINDDIIMVNTTPILWSTDTHKHFNGHYNNIIICILLCNKHTKFYRIPKWLLYCVLQIII